MLLREALSSQNTTFAKLMRSGQDDVSDDRMPPLPQVKAVDPGRYRMNRKLTPAQRAKLAEEYRFGMSALELAGRYKIHRQTVARQLKRDSVPLRQQLKRTPQMIEQATKLYADGDSLAEVANQLGVEASTIGRALKRAGVKLRPPVADRWQRSRDI